MPTPVPSRPRPPRHRYKRVLRRAPLAQVGPSRQIHRPSLAIFGWLALALAVGIALWAQVSRPGIGEGVVALDNDAPIR